MPDERSAPPQDQPEQDAPNAAPDEEDEAAPDLRAEVLREIRDHELAGLGRRAAILVSKALPAVGPSS